MNPSIKKSKTPVPAAKKSVKKNPAAEAFWNKPTTPVQDEAPVAEASGAELETAAATPETEPERDFQALRRKTAEEKFVFPIVMDSESRIWNAWGNSMWPSVYVLDKEGYLRHFWPGELKWQGNDGDPAAVRGLRQ